MPGLVLAACPPPKLAELAGRGSEAFTAEEDDDEEEEEEDMAKEQIGQPHKWRECN